jgi:hypothetical protein
MLIMAKHTHTSETCSTQDKERQTAFRKIVSNASKNSVMIHGMYVNEPAHTMYILLEAANADQIAHVFDPVLQYGHIESVPVFDLLEL